MPREKPILMSAPMVRAIIDGRKSQTRRVVKPQPEPIPPDVPKAPGDNGWWWPAKAAQSMVQTRDMAAFCPYGQPGDRLWVRETFLTVDGESAFYRADYAGDKKGEREHGIAWTPSIHMPRWASRILLEITDIRVERLNDISEEDARAEGLIESPYQWDDCEHPLPDIAYQHTIGGTHYSCPKQAYRALWEQINGPGSWARNDWVWVVEFRRVKP